MSVNIPALLGLFPERASASTSVDETGSSTIRGPCPYDAIVSLPKPLGFAPQFVAAVEFVRTDPRWGPVYRGDLSDYKGDHSIADLALCGEFARQGLNAWDIDVAFRTSDLYRDKWERDDYRNGTVGKALEGVLKASGNSRPPNVLDLHNGQIVIDTAEPAPRDYTLEDFLLPGKSAVLAGLGGVSKTQLAIQLSIALVLGRGFMGKAVRSGNVIAILGEEDKDEIARRVNAVVRYEKLDGAQIHRLETSILAFPLVGRDIRLTATGENGLAEQDFAESIIAAARSMGDVRLIVLDHLALIHGGDHNAREDAALTMTIVNRIAQETGASVLVLAHTPKSASQQDESDASMIAGSTAFVDQARGAWVLARMREGEARKFGISGEDRKQYVSLTIVKNNYGPTGEVVWFKRVPFDGVGLLEHVILSAQATSAQNVADLEARIVAFVGVYPGQYSKTRLRDSQSGKKNGRFKASKSELEGAIETLIADGRLVNRPPSALERTTFDLGPRVQHVLDVAGP
ncbi:MAG TPA: AAA family ATPase [Roseiarcus sp.]|jgi:hypothetical protein